MANCIGYEKLHVGTVITGPTDATIAGGVACAIVYLDPKASGPVYWRCDGVNPTVLAGVPVYPGGSFVLVGEGNIRKTRFIADVGAGGDLHVAYFDRVDVTTIGFLGSGAPQQMITTGLPPLAEVELELKRIRLGISLLINSDLSREYKQ